MADTKENFFTGDTEPPGVAEAWTCGGCKRLVYNIDRKDNTNFPVPGAPIPKYINESYPQVCNLCYYMYAALNQYTYWRAVNSPKQTKVIRADQWVDFI